jgi:hypothetical protein
MGFGPSFQNPFLDEFEGNLGTRSVDEFAAAGDPLRMEIKEAKHNLMTHAGKIYATFRSEAQVNLFVKVCRHGKNSVLSNSASPHICIVNI